MKLFKQAGFTIIEIMLFLAISGVLIASVLFGTSTAINVQRYRDSVISLQSLLKQQFSDVSNVNNSRDSSLSCGDDGVIDSGPGVPIGQSNCVLLGKFITSLDDGKLSIKNVVGHWPDGLAIGLNDVQALKDLKIHVTNIANDTYEPEWGVTIVNTDGDKLEFSVLIVRSPIAKVVRTFVNPTTSVIDDQIDTLLDINALSNPVTICMNSNGLFTGNRMAVVIGANATSPSDVETLGDNSGC